MSADIRDGVGYSGMQRAREDTKLSPLKDKARQPHADQSATMHSTPCRVICLLLRIVRLAFSHRQLHSEIAPLTIRLVYSARALPSIALWWTRHHCINSSTSIGTRRTARPWDANSWAVRCQASWLSSSRS